MKMLKRWISVCLVILLLAGVAFDHSSLIGSTVEAAGLEETDGAEPAETPDASEETTDVPSLLSEGDGSDTPAPEAQTVTNTEMETEAPAEKTETKQEESTGPEKQTVTNSDTETKAPAEKTETKQEESTEPAKQTVTNTDNETKEPVTKTSDDVSKESAQPSAYKDKYEDDTVTISVSAEAGIVPEGAELSVTPIEKTEITDDMSEEDKAKAEEINAQYDLTEKKLNEDSEENEETMEGFLAYDISFLVNGEEVEPSGDVKVVMDFKEAAIPEGVSEDAAVAVKHLKEDETAEDGVVVEDMAEKADVQTTDKAEVEKVELTSDSFSTFLIYWGNDSDRCVTVHYVNTSGAEITVEGTKNEKVDSGDWVDLSKYAIKIDNCTYQEAHLNSYNGKSVEEIKCDKRRWYYRNSSSGDERQWDAHGERHVYLVYEQEIKVHFVSGADGHNLQDPMSLEDFFSEHESGVTADLAPKIEGHRFVKTMIAGVYDQYEGTYNDNVYWALRLRESNGQYQYNRARMDTAGDNQWIEINNQVYFIYKPDTFQITTRDSSSDGITLNLFNYDNSIKEAGVAAGFPFYNGKVNHVDGSTGSSNTGGDVKETLGNDGYPVAEENNGSLAFLFGGNAMSANYLFSYDAASYSYEYDSQKNHAYYDEDEKRFYVYDYTLSPADTSDSAYGDFEVGNFFPFNDTINPQKGELNFIQYGREQRTNVDYWFGMSMNMNFYQPENGVLPNGDAMRFEFRGDDDVFVYLDGVLILDLGGIHAAQSGTIDFSTGTIEENGTTITDGIYRRYQDSGLFSRDDLDEMFTEITVNGQTRHIFADYKNVDMDFFYLERGAGASNCHIKFNMPPIPDDTIIVGKQITDANASVYSDVEFSFKLETKAEGAEDYTTVTNGRVKVYDSTGALVDAAREVNSDGIFKLKHGERAYFEGYPVTTQYRVTELGVSSEEYDRVTIAGVTVTQIGAGGDTTVRRDWRTDDLTVAETPMVVFRNRIADTNQRELNIKKEIADNDNDATYQVQVYLGDEATSETGTPYAGSYWINGVEYQATNGIISLKKGQTASIIDIPSGTSFKVVEVNLDSNTYVDPKYAVENADTPGTEGAATGKLVLTADTLVTVTNALADAPDTLFIEVQKTFVGLDDLSEDEWNQLKEDFKIDVYDSTGAILVKELSLNDKDCEANGNTYSWKIEISSTDIDGSELKYQIQESGTEIEGYELTVSVNGKTVNSTDKVETVITNPTFSIRGSDFKEENQCSTTQFDFETNFIAARIERNAQYNYFVWTEDELSAMEREALVDMVIVAAGNDWSDMAVSSTLFYSDNGDNSIRDGIEVAGNIVKLDEKNILTFSATNQWQKVCGGFYEKTAGRDSEIAITNSYEPETVSIDLVKYGSSFEGNKLTGAEFSLYQGNLGNVGMEWEKTPMADYGQISVSPTGTPELSLPSGYYMLKETKAPDGYQLLDEEIYFKVENGNVSLINSLTGEELRDDDLPDMWEVSTDGGTITIKIKNNILYELPSAGGPGIYWYTIGGMLLMIAGTLVLYKNKRREVLER